MQWWEAQRFLNGYQRRQRTAWLTTRHLEYMIARFFGSKDDLSYPDTPSDLYPFSWEEGHTTTDADIQSAHDLIKQENEKNQRNHSSLLGDAGGEECDSQAD